MKNTATMQWSKRALLLLFAALITISCETEKPQNMESFRVPSHPIGVPVKLTAPLGLPPALSPKENLPTAESIALGRKLFYDVRLSADDTISCASCHNPALHFTDGRSTAAGVGGLLGKRNSPTVLNAVYNELQFWDGRAVSLEQQAGGPIADVNEMNQPHNVCVEKLEADQAYREEFKTVYGTGQITMDKIEKAIAAFERTLVSGNSAFDRYRFGGEKKALTPAAIRGLAIFEDKTRGNCVTCHTIGPKFAIFTDNQFHNLGVGMDASGDLKDPGRFLQTGNETNRGAFRTPSLRNVAKTAPYMHDGSLKTLKEVVDFYVGGGSSNPQLDKQMKQLTLTGRERDDLVAFLESLTGEIPADAGPPVKKD